MRSENIFLQFAKKFKASIFLQILTSIGNRKQQIHINDKFYFFTRIFLETDIFYKRLAILYNVFFYDE